MEREERREEKVAGGPRFVAAERTARLWSVLFVSFGLGPDEAGPNAGKGPRRVLPPALRATPLPEGGALARAMANDK